ncbi:MAG: RagB/SusD family nutrient uptake outer membrane protein [Saprospiraceae bacterium]
MKNSILKFFGAVLLVTSVYACSDFLNVEVNNQLSIEEFYATDEDADQAVLAAYDILQWHQNVWGSGWSSPYMVKTLPSDEGQAGGANAGDQPNYVALDRFTFDATNAPIEATWAVNYYGIYRCNLVINNVEGDSDLKKRVVAEAKGLRAYYYSELVTLFGDVPLILKELAPSEYNQSRTAKAQVYSQIEKDLSDAIAALPVKSAYSASDKFRVSKGTAQALLGKILLYQEKYGDAAIVLDNLIQSMEYDLEPDFAKVFSEDGELGMESVFEVVYITTAGYDWGANGYPWGASAESNVHIQLMGAREGVFSGVDSLNNGWGFNYPSPKLWNAFIAAGDEVRRKETLMSEEEYIAGGGTVSDPTTFDYEGYIRRKYGSYSTEGSDGVFQLNYGTNWRLIRYADVLLMAAEAHHKSGDDGSARTELNKVRLRAGLDDVTASGNDLFNAIVNERQLELAFEGHRYLDLIRWGKAGDEISNFQTGKHELLPVPQNELLTAPNMSQNTGY